jgi:hypothetical protein
MRLQQGQTWKQGDNYYRIVEWARMSITYKTMTDLESREGTMHRVSKKEFCRLIKDAVLMPAPEPRPKSEGELDTETDSTQDR